MQWISSYRRILRQASPHLPLMMGVTVLALGSMVGLALIEASGLISRNLLIGASLLLGTFLALGFLQNTLRLSRGLALDPYAFVLVSPVLVGKLIATVALMALIILGGLCLFLVPGLMAFSAFYFAPVLVVDKGLGPVQALRESARLTRGHRREILLAHLVASALYSLASIPGFTLVLTMPLYWFFLVTPYLEYSAELENGPAEPYFSSSSSSSSS